MSHLPHIRRTRSPDGATGYVCGFMAGRIDGVSYFTGTLGLGATEKLAYESWVFRRHMNGETPWLSQWRTSAVEQEPPSAAAEFHELLLRWARSIL
jgi:hypothetical protein